MSQLSSNLSFTDLLNKWSSVLNPIIGNPLTNPRIIKSISLINGATVINHGLQQMQQGWYIVDLNAAATIYKSQPFNSNTLTLTSNLACVIDLVVF